MDCRVLRRGGYREEDWGFTSRARVGFVVRSRLGGEAGRFEFFFSWDLKSGGLTVLCAVGSGTAAVLGRRDLSPVGVCIPAHTPEANSHVILYIKTSPPPNNCSEPEPHPHRTSR